MKLTTEIKTFIKSTETLKLEAYLCPANRWTIGYGNTYYEDGKPVKRGDKISRERAELLFNTVVENFALQTKRLIRAELNDNQFSALVSFAYNVGIGKSGLGGSTLLRKVNVNPHDVTIRDEFAKWNKSGGKVLNGLTERRKKEAEIYFK